MRAQWRRAARLPSRRCSCSSRRRVFIVANVFYTCGWILELLVAKVWRVSTPVFGPIAFTLGTALSVVVTLVPPASSFSSPCSRRATDCEAPRAHRRR